MCKPQTRLCAHAHTTASLHPKNSPLLLQRANLHAAGDANICCVVQTFVVFVLPIMKVFIHTDKRSISEQLHLLFCSRTEYNKIAYLYVHTELCAYILCVILSHRVTASTRSQATRIRGV